MKVFFSYRDSTFLCQLLSTPRSFSFPLSVYLPPLSRLSVCILPDCDQKDCCFWLSNKNRCTAPDRNYKLLSTNNECVPFSTRGRLEYISLRQSDKKENKEICHRVVAEITVSWFNEKWRHNLAIYSSMSWFHRRGPWVALSLYAQEYIVVCI